MNVSNKHSKNSESDRDEIPPGTLYLLILKTLAVGGKLHGYEIAEGIEHTSDNTPDRGRIALPLPSSACSSKDGSLRSRGVTAGNRRARYYTLTAEGRKQLRVEISQFERVMGAITRVIQTA